MAPTQQPASIKTCPVGTAVQTIMPEMFPFFLAALRTGMRRGELLALRWGDCSFGGGEDDQDRFFMVQRTYSDGHFGTPKSGRARRVDMSKQLRGVLLDLRDQRMITAMQLGKDSIADDLLFVGEDGGPLCARTIGVRFMEPALARAGLRRFTPHALRHTFAVLGLQSGLPLKYVSEQLGHASIIVTANVYGHLQPGANVHLIDRLDVPAANANQAQTQGKDESRKDAEAIDCTLLSGTQSEGSALIAY